MLRSFLKDSVLYSVGIVSSRLISLFIISIYTAYLTANAIGIIDIMTVFASIANVTVALEVSIALAIYNSETKDEETKYLYSSTAFTFTLITYTLFSLTVICCAEWFSNNITGLSGSEHIIVLSGLTIWFGGLLYLAQNQLRWRLRAGSNALCGFIQSLMLLCASYYLLHTVREGLTGVFAAQLFSTAIATILACFFARHDLSLRIKWVLLKKLLSFSVPLLPSSLGVIGALYVDRLVINSLLGLEEVGIYGVACRFASIVLLVMTGFQGALVPLIFNNYQEDSTRKDLPRVFNAYTSIALIVVLGLSLYAKDILELFTTSYYYRAAGLIPILSLGIIVSSLYIFTPGASISKKTAYLTIINILAAVINLGLNFLLIPVMGIAGAALATLLAACIGFGCHYWVSQKYYKIEYALLPTSGIFLLILAIGFFWNLSPISNQISLSMAIAKGLVIILLATGILTVIMGKADIRRLEQTIRNSIDKEIHR